MQAILLRLFVEIDFLIHQGVSEVLKLIFRIADTEIFSEGSIATFTSRVYGVLGVLILFKIIISAIQYLINPDKMADKDKGFGGLLSRTIISVAMLALVPTIFDFARLAQDKISVAIPQIVLGMKIDNTSDIQAIGDNMSWVTVKAFVSAKEGKNTSGYPMESLENFKDNVTQGCGWLWADENCIYDYNFFFSIIVGVFMLYILLSMAIDVAIRTIKFGLIEILAPIPIASYINNQENFKSWYQNAFKVYADLFIRFIIIYFIIFVIVTLTEGKITIKSSGEVVSVLSDPFLYVFLIVGLLMFAKQAPKFISDLLGLKSDGMGGIADMFTRGAAFGGAGKAAYDTFKSNYVTQSTRLSAMTDANGHPLSKGRQLATALKSAAAGSASAFGRGVWMATVQGKKGYGEIKTAANKGAVAKRDERNYFHDNLESEDYSWRDYKRDKRNAAIGMPSTPEFTKAQYDTMDGIAKSIAGEKSYGATKMNETPTKYVVEYDGRGYTIASARGFANIQIGTQGVVKPDGSVGTWNETDYSLAQAAKENVEKRTAYLATAGLLSTNDPTAVTNHSKSKLEIKNNLTKFVNDRDVSDKIAAYVNDLQENIRKGKVVIHDAGLQNSMLSVSSMEDILNLLERSPGKDINSIEDYSRILEMSKTITENVASAKYETAQAADAKAKKTQAAVNNNKKS